MSINPNKQDTNVLFDDSSDEDRHVHEEEHLEIEKEVKEYNQKVPNFGQRVHLYLKPSDYSAWVLTVILIIETVLSWIFIYFQFDYILTWEFESLTDKAMQIIIGFGVVGGVLIYTIADSIRFLPGHFDKVLCVASSLLMKPILLPILFPGTFFKSPLAVRRAGKYVHTYDDIQETRFMMAVQETNFLLTFTLAGVSAMSTFFAVA